MLKRLFTLSAGPPRLPGHRRKQHMNLTMIETTTLKENENGH